MQRSESEKLIRRATLRQLQIFVTVAELRSYTKAAEYLHLTQPTISMQVRKLSETIGLPLFEQVNKKLHISVAGQKVLQAAKDILDRLSYLSDDIMSLKHKVKGELHIASVSNAKYFMPRLLGIFLQKYPDVIPYLKVTNRSRVIKRMKNGDMDELFILGKLDDKLAEDYQFLENKLVVIANPQHPLATQKRQISLQQLSKARFLVRETGSGTRLAVEKLFNQHQLKPNCYMELGSSEAIKQAVMAGLGLSVLSRNNLKMELEGKHIVELDVAGFPLMRHWYVMHLKNKKLSLVAQTFLDFLLTEGKKVLLENIKLV